MLVKEGMREGAAGAGRSLVMSGDQTIGLGGGLCTLQLYSSLPPYSSGLGVTWREREEFEAKMSGLVGFTS